MSNIEMLKSNGHVYEHYRYVSLLVPKRDRSIGRMLYPGEVCPGSILLQQMSEGEIPNNCSWKSQLYSVQ